jgi:hypothetical protein
MGNISSTSVWGSIGTKYSITDDTNTGILSTNVRASKTLIKLTESSTMPFFYNGREHPTLLQVYLNDNLLLAKTRNLGIVSSDSFQFIPDFGKEGKYTIKITPTDTDYRCLSS